jgi:hypothetical protein
MCDVCSLLEADHHVVVDVYDMFLEVDQRMRQINWRNTLAVSQEFHESLLTTAAEATRIKMVAEKVKADLDHARSVVQPAINYFDSHFGDIGSNGIELPELDVAITVVEAPPSQPS